MDTLGIFVTNAGEYPESLSFSKLQTNILITLSALQRSFYSNGL